MNWRRLFRREMAEEWRAEWNRAHRWDELARYNTRVSQGIVHTPEYVARMREEQEAFYAEQEAERDARYRAARRFAR